MANETVPQKTIRTMVDALDDLDRHRCYAQTFAHMLDDLLCENDEIPKLGVNDPASRSQRMFACLESLKKHLATIELVEGEMRAA